AAARLEDVDRKLGVPESPRHLAGGLLDGLGLLLVEQTQAVVDPRAGELDQPQGVHETRRQRLARDRKVFDRALGGGAVIGSLGPAPSPQAVTLDALSHDVLPEAS